MDKALILTVLLMIATPLIVLILGIGWLMDDERFSEGQHDSDNDIRIYVPMRHRNRRGNNRCNKQGDKE